MFGCVFFLCRRRHAFTALQFSFHQVRAYAGTLRTTCVGAGYRQCGVGLAGRKTTSILLASRR